MLKFCLVSLLICGGVYALREDTTKNKLDEFIDEKQPVGQNQQLLFFIRKAY